MSARLPRVLHAVTAAGLLLVCALTSVSAAEIKQLRIETGATGTRAELQLDQSAAYQLIHLSNPERLAVDFPASHFKRGLALPAAAGIVKTVRTGQPVPGTVRVVFDLASAVRAMPSTIETAANGYLLILEWPADATAVAGSANAPSGSVQEAAHDPIALIAAQSVQVPVPSTVESGQVAVVETPVINAPAATTGTASTAVDLLAEDIEKTPAPAAGSAVSPALTAGMRPLIVAIDAGHGGQDPGAIGKNGTREKDVTLAIARELARQINATPGLKAFLTRDADVFIPLEQRARRANANKADIFLSIHADAAENRNAKGSSVYVLSTRGASSQRARWLADKENAADIIGGHRVQVADNTLTSVLLDLTQSGNMKASESAAEHVLGGLKGVGNIHKANVEHANFAVLRTSDKMPAMLVETAFISNPDEEKRLTDPAHQRTMARAILQGVDRYFSRQPPPGTLYAARAKAEMTASAKTTPPARSAVSGGR
jgi:N-acetylmuramoyl-L-alanine amidase